MKIKYSGHETFAFRYVWLPKAYLTVKNNPNVFFDENSAMVELGVGKNMVSSIRHWCKVTQLVQIDEGKTGGRYLCPTSIASQLLLDGKLDPFMEDDGTVGFKQIYRRSDIEQERLLQQYYGGRAK